MDKEAKKMTYAIEPIVGLARDKLISDGGTRKKASTLEGRWIRLNETVFAFEESGKVTLIHSSGNSVGCACGRCDNGVMCEHLIAFEDLKSKPQLTIESPEYRWLREYLFRLGWFADGGYVHPSADNRPLDPVNEDHDLNIGVGDDEEPEPKKYSRKCGHPGCGYIEVGEDRETVIAGIAEHRRTCPKNPANKKRSQANDVTIDETDVPIAPKQAAKETVAPEEIANLPHDQPTLKAIGDDRLVETDASGNIIRDSATTEKPTVAKNATVEKPPKEDKKVKPSTAVTKTEPRTPAVKKEMPTEAEFQATKVGRLMKSQGSIYRAGGKEVADSAAVSSYAVSSGVSTETIILEQTIEYARATVRAHKGGRYTDGSVLIRRDAILEKLMIDLAEKNPSWIIGWSNGLPEFDLDQTVFIGDKRKILGLHIAGVVADKWMFASRDCETKAGRRAQIKILGADWREDDEVESEVEEMNTVAKR